MEDNEEDYEDIVVEFEGNFDLDSVKNKELQIVGIDTDEPVLRIDSKFYKINIKDSIGTRLILEQNPENEKLEYYAKTDKVVTARRIIVKPK